MWEILTGVNQVSLLMSLTYQACHHCLLGRVQNKHCHFFLQKADNQTEIHALKTLQLDSPGEICILQPESCCILEICSPPLPITENKGLINIVLFMRFKCPPKHLAMDLFF